MITDTMSDKNKDIENSLSFVVSHYEEGQFDKTDAWRKIVGRRIRFFDKRWITAASIVFAIAASAFVYSIVSTNTSRPEIREERPVKTEEPTQVITKSEKIEYKNAPLTEVIKQIEEIYGVHIYNIPSEELTVTISYEGSAEEVIDILNDTFNINLKIK